MEAEGGEDLLNRLVALTGQLHQSAQRGEEVEAQLAVRNRVASPQHHVLADHEVVTLLEAGEPGPLAKLVPERAAAHHADAPALAAAGLERLGVRGPTGRVLVPAGAGLPPELPGCHLLRLERARLPARLAEALLHERLGHLQAHVDPHQVHQLEGPHAEAAGEPHDPVDLLVRRDPLLEQPQRLGAERTVATVHQEPGPVLSADHALAHPLRQLGRHRDRVLSRLLGCDHLHQLHHRRRVEEVHPHDVLRSRRGVRERGDEDRRRVRREHEVRVLPRQLREQLALELRPLGHRLDH